MRPVPARWFEAIAARDELARLAESLARSGAVEIESEAAEPERSEQAVSTLLREYEALSRRYGPYWPGSEPAAQGSAGPPLVVLGKALETLHAWSAKADPLIAELEKLDEERADLLLLSELLDAARSDLPDLVELVAAGPRLATRLFALPRAKAEALDLLILGRHVVGPRHGFLFVVGTTDAIERTERAMSEQHARRIVVPETIVEAGTEAPERIRARLLEIERASLHARDALDALGEELCLDAALADFRRLHWFVRSVPPLPHTRHFALVTGWTSDQTGTVLREALESYGVDGLVHYPPPPPHHVPPIVLDNPSWVRPFETISQLIGMPSEREADPSLLLAVIVPLLFGFMFGDVGQGFVLVLVGLLLGRRIPKARLIVAGGVASMAFGVLYGSVFCREDLIPALWLHPFAEPFTLLVVSVIGGASILVLGLLLRGLEAHWEYAMKRWLATDAGLLVTYLGLLLSLLHSVGSLIALAGGTWFIVGSALTARARKLAAAGSALGHLVERTLQLVVNTISFARVGAFALAHTGLSVAVVSMSDATGNLVGSVVVLVVGNALIIVLEGLTVGIQTARLVLFEFFVRFLRGEGRAFHPLAPPPVAPPPTTGGVPNV